MKLARWKAIAGGCFLAAFLSLPAWGNDADSRRQAVPGTLNYVEGQASMNEQTIDAKAVGNAELENGQVLETGKGKVEILLTPGVYLRIGDHSAVKMISSSLTSTEVSLDHGEAMLEVDQIYPQNNIRIDQPGAETRVLKTGLYAFDASREQLRVFDGKAVVTADDRNTTVKKDHQLALAGDKLKAHGFKQDEVTKNDDLYRWSSLRSEYLSEANVDSAHLFYANGWLGAGWWGPGWGGAGWYWDPWFAGFTFLPGAGFFYNPFGWGFYSPYMAWRAPYFGGVHAYQHFDGSRPVAIGRGFNNHAVTSFNGARGGGVGAGGGFHAGSPGAGGFHGGGGFGGHR
jgi:FecR protein